MNKKAIGIILIIMIIGVSIGILVTLKNSKEHNSSTSNNLDSSDSKVGDDNMNENSVVLYFSATGTTEKIAQYISEITNSKMVEIIPVKEYTNDDLDYNNDNSRANKEQNDNTARPAINNEIDINQYDIVYLGYPIWWGDVPKIILTLMENNNFSGKTIIPFCTSGGSDISMSVTSLKKYHNNVLNGQKFSANTTKSEVESWINKLNNRK